MYNVIVFVCLVTYIYSAPLMTNTEAMVYLKKYGYAIDSQDENNFPEAMKRFQSFMGLGQTGRMNEESSGIMRLPRCGMADIGNGSLLTRQRRYAYQGSRWTGKKVTYSIMKYSQKLDRATIDKEVQEAFDLWSKHTNITFEPKNIGDVNIEIAFYLGHHQDVGPFDGPGGDLAHGFYPVFGGHIHFDESEEWTSGENRGINFKYVAVHEIGHAIGLLHSSQKEAIMFPTYDRYLPKIEFSQDDIDGITKLYTSDFLG